MATTTNNSWPTPNDSDPFKLGASAMRDLGQAIDTSVGTGLLAWQNWTPTLSGGWANGNGTWYARYVKIGKTVIASGYFTVGSTTTRGTGMNISLPIAAVNTTNINGTAWVAASAAANLSTVHVYPNTTTQIALFAQNVAGTFLQSNSITTTAPITWATGSVISFTVIYEVA